MPIQISTWNINSVRIRDHLIAAHMAETNPDIICLQETKAQDIHFPEAALRAHGFDHIAFSGEKSYNGVAILSKLPLSDVTTTDILGNGSKRHIAATLPDGTRLHNLYIPAGGDIPDPEVNPKFAEKLAFVDWLIGWSTHEVNPREKTIIVGDFNIAPLEHDVWSHKQLLNVVSHTPPETERMSELRDSIGWIDVARHFTPAEEKLYSWWSYRNRDWKKSDRGRRLDHIWVTPALKNTLQNCTISRHARDWDSPSDHVPVTVTLEI